MSERYYITGVQIGTIKALIRQLGLGETNATIDDNINYVLREIENKQFIGNIQEWERTKKEIRIVEVKK